MSHQLLVALVLLSAYCVLVVDAEASGSGSRKRKSYEDVPPGFELTPEKEEYLKRTGKQLNLDLEKPMVIPKVTFKVPSEVIPKITFKVPSEVNPKITFKVPSEVIPKVHLKVPPKVIPKSPLNVSPKFIPSEFRPNSFAEIEIMMKILREKKQENDLAMAEAARKAEEDIDRDIWASIEDFKNRDHRF